MTDRRGNWFLTFTGRRFWPMDPHVEDLDIRDIAHHLALENRWNGATREPYSVAEHSVRVSLEIGRRLRDLGEYTYREGRGVFIALPPPASESKRWIELAGLMHDGSEGMGFRDVVRPVKHEPEMHLYRAADDRCQSAIYNFAGVGYERRHPLIKQVDAVLLVTERRDLCAPCPDPIADERDIQPLVERIIPWTWQEAELRFLQRWTELRGGQR